MQADDRDARIAELEAEVVRVKKVAAEQGTQLIRMSIALRMAQRFGIHSEAFNAAVARTLADWVRLGDWGPVPYLGADPFFCEWAEAQGLSDCDGHVGYRATATLLPAARAGQERKGAGDG